MGFHLLCSDGLGRCMAVTVYIIMFAGNLNFFLAVVKPAFDGPEDILEKRLIEYAAYLFFWSMMVISHMSTMCIDPGFIPNGYQYDEKVLAGPFSTLAAAFSAVTGRDEESQSMSNLNNTSTNNRSNAVEMGVIPKMRAEENNRKRAIEAARKGNSHISVRNLQQI